MASLFLENRLVHKFDSVMRSPLSITQTANLIAIWLRYLDIPPGAQADLIFDSNKRFSEMSEIPPKIVLIALEHCETSPFEFYAQTVFSAVLGQNFKPLGGPKTEERTGLWTMIFSKIHLNLQFFFKHPKKYIQPPK